MKDVWEKSSYSDTGNHCVECRTDTGQVLIRDTQNRENGHLTFPSSEWRAFMADLDMV